jgi:hypothetical protein
VTNPDEEYRFEGITLAKLRGKGAPKKKREKDGESGTTNEAFETLKSGCAYSGEDQKKEIICTSVLILAYSIVLRIIASKAFGIILNNWHHSYFQHVPVSLLCMKMSKDSSELFHPYNISGLSMFQTPLPPSTSILTPVMNFPSSLAKNRAAFATSIGSVNRPYGMISFVSCRRLAAGKRRTWYRTRMT